MSTCAHHTKWSQEISWEELDFHALPATQDYPNAGAIVLLDNGKIELFGSSNMQRHLDNLEWLADQQAFQYLAILHQDRVTGMKAGKREFGQQIEIRCWDSQDAVTATPTHLPFEILQRLAARITTEVNDIVSVTYNITSKPPSTIEAV